MDDSRIVIAMKKFLRDYEWDKSLSNSSSNSSPLASQAPGAAFNKYVHVGSDTAIQEFINASGE